MYLSIKVDTKNVFFNSFLCRLGSVKACWNFSYDSDEQNSSQKAATSSSGILIPTKSAYVLG